LERLGYEVTEDGDIVPEGEGDGSGAPGDGGAPLVGKRYGRIPSELGIYYYHGDHLGSSNVITDRKGRTYEHVEYFPYGETWVDEQRSQTNLPYRFTGKELDPETGMYYFGARYYEPRISRWVSADPILDKYLPTGRNGGNENLPGMGGVFNPVNLNLYKYAAQEETHEIKKSVIDTENVDFLNVDARTITDLTVGTIKSGVQVSGMHVSVEGKSDSGTFEARGDYFKYRGVAEGGVTNYTAEAALKVAAVEGELSGTINLPSLHYVRFTVSGSAASLGVEGKVGLKGVKFGLHTLLGGSLGVEWGTKEVEPIPTTGTPTPLADEVL
jgi:RHS repeat-associated protein